MRIYFFLAAWAFCLLGARAQTVATLNLSHDLVRLGIASQNLTPNTPSLDARPLFQSALAYVATHPIQVITLDQGSYYFLTPQNGTAYLDLDSLANVTVDLAGSNIYFATSFIQGFFFANCNQVALTNFQIDFITPPYTYVQLAGVNTTARTLTYTTLPGWVDPVTFNGAMTPDGPPVLWAVDFRNGDIVSGTSRMNVATPIVQGTLSLVQDNTPWTQSGTLSTLQKGDTLVVTERGGGPPVNVGKCNAFTISNGTVYGGGAIAVLLTECGNSTVSNVRVMPRPGNLTASNADGIHFIEPSVNVHIQNCYVNRTLDDALVIDSSDIATVSKVTGTRSLTVTRTALLVFSNGSFVNFVDPTNGAEITGATIVSQNPPGMDAPVFGGSVDLTFDSDLPAALAVGYGMAFGLPTSRGMGSGIINNTVGEALFGRGVWIGGSQGILIQGNTIGHTSSAGINIYHDTTSYPTPAAHDITIQNNVVTGSTGPMASGSGTQIALGGIAVDSVGTGGQLATISPNTNVTIQGNTIYDSGRTGIWVGELNGGTVTNNTINGYGQYPQLPLFGLNAQTAAFLTVDFTQPTAVYSNLNVSFSNNPTSSGLPSFTSGASLAGYTGVAFSFQVTTTGAPTAFSASGPLPAGLALDTATGLITGTPTAAGTFPLTITATNTAGSANQAISISILSSPGNATDSPVVGGSGFSPASYQNISFSGNTYDQVLMTGSQVTASAKAGHITRVSFIDEYGDICFAEFSGSGQITVSMDAPVVASPVNYNQPTVLYATGRASITVAGHDATTFLSVYSLGTDPTRVDPSIIINPAALKGIAYIQSVTLSNTAFGGLNLANTKFLGSTGVVGVSAVGLTQLTSPTLYLGDLNAGGVSLPAIQFGIGANVTLEVAGGNLSQPDAQSVTVSGLLHVGFVAGQTSTGQTLPASTIAGTLVDYTGNNVTAQLTQ